MKLNLDSVVSNLAAVWLECSALKTENVVSILAEVEAPHLAAGDLQFRYERRTCAARRINDEHIFAVCYQEGGRSEITGLLVVITLLKSEQSCSRKRPSSKHLIRFYLALTSAGKKRGIATR